MKASVALVRTCGVAILLGATNFAVAEVRSSELFRHIQTDQHPFTDTQLNSFASAAINVMDIRQRYLQRRAVAQDDGERQALQQEGAEEMGLAIEDEGLSVDVYNSIVNAARSNPTLRFRIDLIISEFDEQRG